MKRLLIISILFLGVFSSIKADEKEDSLRYYFQQALTAYNNDDYQDAGQSFENTLRLYKELSGDVSQDTVYAYIENKYANLCCEIGDYEKAILLGTNVKKIRETVFGRKHPNYALSLINLADYYSHNDDYSKAIELGTQALELYNTVLGCEQPECAMILNNLALYYSNIGVNKKAIELGKQALDYCRAIYGEEHPNYALSLSNLAEYYSNIGDYTKAIELETKVLEIYRVVFGDEHPSYSVSLNKLADYYSNNGNHKKSIELITKAFDFYVMFFGEDLPDYAVKMLNTLALSNEHFGNYDRAIELGTRVLDYERKNLGEEHPDYAISLGNLAHYYTDIGNYGEAFRIDTKASEIIKKALGENDPYYATSLSNLASIHAHLGNYDEAIRLGTKAMEIRKAVLGENHPDYAKSLCNLANYYDDIANYNKAIQLGSEAMIINRKILGEKDLAYAQSLSGLAASYNNLGNYDEAIRLGTKAMEIRKAVLGENHPDYAMSLHELAVFYSHNNIDAAIRFGIEALDVWEKVFGKDHPACASALLNIAFFYSELDNYAEATQSINRYFSVVRKHVLNTFSSLTANERTLFWDKYNFEFSSSITNFLFNSGSLNVASFFYDNAALFAKGLLLSTEQEMAKLIQESGDTEALKMYSELHQNRQILNAQYSKPIADRYIDCDSLERVSNYLERQLVTRVKEFGDYTRNLSITWRDVQSKLDDNDIAIEFLSYPEKDGKMHYAVLTLCKNDTAPLLTSLFVESKLMEASGNNDTYQTATTDSLVWGAISSRLEGKTHVYFSASGILHSIGIEYLPSMKEKKCYRLSSTRELVTQPSNEALRSATLYGDINYDATYASIESSIPNTVKDYAKNEPGHYRDNIDYRSINNGVCTLPGTRVELDEISALMKPLGVPYDAITGIQASEESFKALSGQHRSLLHISTHGFYYNDENANSLKPHLRQVLMGDDRPSHTEEKSLLRCGLCFAGANQTLLGKSQPSEGQGDGILNALEIAQTDLRGLDLVVLSACQTALGDVTQGEGVIGLQRGFKKAGAKSILMTLWDVDDLTTQLLMSEFYKNYLAGKSKQESLHAAQKYIREYKDDNGNKLFESPYYWAGFILLDALD